MKLQFKFIRAKRSQAGFTLLEILVAMVLATVGMLGIASLTTGIIRGNLYSKNVTSATMIAQGHIEDIQRAGFAGAGALAGTQQVSMGGVTFTRATTVAVEPTDAKIKNVTVTVTWNEGAVGSKTVNFNTRLSE